MDYKVDVIVGREVQVVLVSFFVYVFHVCFVIVKLYTSRLSFSYHTFNVLCRQNLLDRIHQNLYLNIYMCKLETSSTNVRGMNDFQKRRDIFHYLRQQNSKYIVFKIRILLKVSNLI